MQADMAVLGKTGEPVLLVEVKNKAGTSENWAAMLRRNIAAHGFLPNVPYFIVATPDRFYVWKNPPNTPELAPPDYVVDSSTVLGELLDRKQPESERLGGAGLEILIGFWLAALINQRINGQETNGNGWLKESGLQEAVRGGHIVFEEAA
jgi:hypothetical protein